MDEAIRLVELRWRKHLRNGRWRLRVDNLVDVLGQDFRRGHVGCDEENRMWKRGDEAGTFENAESEFGGIGLRSGIRVAQACTI